MPPSIHEIKAKYEKQLMAHPGVVSVGVGRDSRGTPAIIVSLDAPRGKNLGAIPNYLHGYRVVTEVTGPLQTK